MGVLWWCVCTARKPRPRAVDGELGPRLGWLPRDYLQGYLILISASVLKRLLFPVTPVRLCFRISGGGCGLETGGIGRVGPCETHFRRGFGSGIPIC